MAKRLTDSDKWDDPWFIELPAKYKLMWLMILDKCDHAGIYKVSSKSIKFNLDEDVDFDEVQRYFKDRILMFSQEKWFIPKFIIFQYGALNPSNNIHASVIRRLQGCGLMEEAIEHGLIKASHGDSEGFGKGCPGVGQGFGKGAPGGKAKDKDKDKEKDKEKEQEQETEQETGQETGLGQCDNVTIGYTAECYGLLDAEKDLWEKGCAVFGQELVLTRPRRYVLRHIRGHSSLGSAKFLKACEELARSDFPLKSITYFTDKGEGEAENRVDLWAQGGPPRGMPNGNGGAKWKRGMQDWLQGHPEFREEYEKGIGGP